MSETLGPSTLVIGEWQTMYTFDGDGAPGTYLSNSEPFTPASREPLRRPVPSRIQDEASTTTRSAKGVPADWKAWYSMPMSCDSGRGSGPDGQSDVTSALSWP